MQNSSLVEKLLSWKEALESSQRLSWEAAEMTQKEKEIVEALESLAESLYDFSKRKAEKFGESKAFEAQAAEWASALENPFKK